MAKEFQWDESLVKEHFDFFMKGKYSCNADFRQSLKDFIASKQPKPSFTTADGVDIFKDDEYFLINDWIVYEAKCLCGRESYLKEDKSLSFSTREAAEQYIIENKPCLSLKDLLEISENNVIHTLRPEIKEILINLINSRL